MLWVLKYRSHIADKRQMIISGISAILLQTCEDLSEQRLRHFQVSFLIFTRSYHLQKIV